MGKFNAVLKDLGNMINSLINKQEVKYYVKKGGRWEIANEIDLMFFNKNEFFNVLPRKRGDLTQTNTWEGLLLAIFIGNSNNKDTGYINAQLAEAERMAPVWVRENSNLVA